MCRADFQNRVTRARFGTESDGVVDSEYQRLDDSGSCFGRIVYRDLQDDDGLRREGGRVRGRHQSAPG